MRRSIRAFFLCLVILLTCHPHLPANAAGSTHTLAGITPTWTTGNLNYWVGYANIFVADVNKDGKNEIAACDYDTAFLLSHYPSGYYDTAWYSEVIGCRKIALADRNGDGYLEIFVLSYEGQVLVFDGNGYQLRSTFSAPEGYNALDLDVADVDSDGKPEIILTYPQALKVYDAASFALEWDAASFGGQQAAVGNIDNDPALEIVVNGDTGRALNAVTKQEKWSYEGGFGHGIALGDVDGDKRAEIAFYQNWNYACVLDGDTQRIKWQLTSNFNITHVSVGDTNGDGIAEVVFGDGQWGDINGYDGASGAKLWSIPNPNWGVSGLAVGDTNNDGSAEIVWASDTLFVGSPKTQSVLWRSPSMGAENAVTGGDIDQDGHSEIVVATDGQIGLDQGVYLRVHDGATRRFLWSSPIITPASKPGKLEIAQLDGDDALEILLYSPAAYSAFGTLSAVDGVTHEKEWQMPVEAGIYPIAATSANLDQDPASEIIVGRSNNHLQVLDGDSHLMSWDSGRLPAAILDVETADLDGDGVIEIVALTAAGLHVYGTDTGMQENELLRAGWTHMALANSDLAGAGEVLVLSKDGSNTWLLEAFNGLGLTPLWQRTIKDAELFDIYTADLDSDGFEEFVLAGSYRFNGGSYFSSLLWIGSQNYPCLWETQLSGKHGGAFDHAAAADIDADGKLELLLGGWNVQVNEITTATRNTLLTYLPAVAKPRPGRGIHGYVTYNGQPAANVALELRYYDGASWSTRASTLTTASGLYSFLGALGVGGEQAYYVRYQNTSHDYLRLWMWGTRELKNYASGSEVELGSFDLANINLVAPDHMSAVNLPYTFQWTPRPESPSDSYELDMFDPENSNFYFYTPPLGYTGSYTLNSLPTGFSTGRWYVWEVWVYSPDGGFGISYQTRGVKFANTGLQGLSPASEPILPFAPKTIHDLQGKSNEP
jgi:hypothetical protein